MPQVSPGAAEQMFTPDFQKQFWQGLDPDIRAILDLWEGRETWTWRFNELPDFFQCLASTLPELAVMPFHRVTADTVSHLIQLLSAVPMRYAITAVSWLDSQNAAGSLGAPGMSWGILCFQEAARIARHEPDHSVHAWARVFRERICMMVRTRLAVELFSAELINRSPAS